MGNDTAPITILVIEDDPELSFLMRELLEEEGFGVQLACSAKEALAWLETNVPSAIVMDLLMPDLPGWEFDERRRERPRLSDVPVIVTSGLPMTAPDAQRIKAVGRLVKPFSLDVLIALLREHARPAQLFDPTAETVDLRA